MKTITIIGLLSAIFFSCSSPKSETTENNTSIQQASPIVAESTSDAKVDNSRNSINLSQLVHEQCYCDSIPQELVPFVLKGYQVRAYAEGDLNRDGTEDYLLLLSLPYSEESDSQEDELRPLLILTRDKQNKITLAARNDHVVDGCQDCGGQFGDYFDEMVIDSAGNFSIYHLGGMAWRSRNDFSFAYSPSDNDWLLTEETSYNYNSGMTEGDTLFDGEIYMPVESTKTPKDFGKIFFSEYGTAKGPDKN